MCAITAVELHPTFEHYKTMLVRRKRPCGVLYPYQIHPQVGWMYARIQTWFPFQIQVGINGREWLVNQQLQTRWPELLGDLATQLNLGVQAQRRRTRGGFAMATTPQGNR